MLIDFSVENFRSFKGSQSLSMVASKRLGKEHRDHCVEIPRATDHLLRAGVIWGANGAGKSNLFKAMQFSAALILNGTGPKAAIPHHPFAFDNDVHSAPSSFEFRFMVSDVVFSYGFASDGRRILEEWLFLHEGTKEHALFERETSDSGDVSLTLGARLKKKDYPKIHALSEVGTRGNQLFLTSIRENIASAAYGDLILSVVTWFEDQLTFIGPNDSFVQLAELIVEDEKFAEFAGDFLRCSDTGIESLSVETTELNQEAMAANFDPKLLDQILSSLGEGDVTTLAGGNGAQVIVEKSDEAKFKLRRIKADHQVKNSQISALPLAEESDGTRRLLDLLPALYQLKSHCKVFVIDEIDRSLHPNLSCEFLRFFLKACEGKGRQLVVTTHEDRLLDLDLLRRDEIWFVEKNQEGSSELHSLADYKVRKDLKIDKGYLNGRFGGVPHFGHFIGLLPEAAELSEKERADLELAGS